MPAGAPVGNQNAAKAKRWTAAIERILERWPEEPNTTDCTPFMQGLNKAAFAFVGEMMATKDVQFFREFGDRLEGKPAQTVDANLNGRIAIESITCTVVDPKAAHDAQRTHDLS